MIIIDNDTVPQQFPSTSSEFTLELWILSTPHVCSETRSWPGDRRNSSMVTGLGQKHEKLLVLDR